MATEEIEISQLELAEDLAPDMVLPVETTTDTKATTLQKIKEWLGSFFVDKTSDEEISGNKTFLKPIIRKHTLGTGDTSLVEVRDVLEKGKAGVYAYYAGEKIYARLVARNTNSNKNSYIDIQVADDGEVTTYAPASSMIHSIVTTTGISKAQNGYLKLGNGVIIQWGISAKSSSATVTFPVAFSSASSFVVMVNNKTNNGGGYSPSAYEQTTTGFTLKTLGGAASWDNLWLAIGY